MRYLARWADAPERRLYNGANGSVVDLLADKKSICFTHNMATAERIAAALDLAGRFNDDELKRLASSLED